MSTPSPYLRDRLLQAADGLRKDAETARLNVAAADQDVAAARALLQEAEAQAARARAEVDSISRGIAWLEREAAHLAADPGDDPAAKLKATGLMREEPKPLRVAQIHNPGDLGEHCPGSDPADDLVPPGGLVKDSRAEVAPHLPATPPTPHEPAGVPVATSGPLMTMPDTGLAPDPLPPAEPSAEPRHAKPADRPGLLARLTGGHRTIPDNPDGDDA